MIKKLIIFLFLTIQCFATDWYVDNTAPIIQTKLPKAPTGVTYTVYGDVKPTNTTSVLVEDLDILTTNVSSYVVTLTNVTVSGDTTFGEFSIPVSTGTQYVKCGVVATQTDQPETIVGAAIMYMDAIKIDSTSQRP